MAFAVSAVIGGVASFAGASALTAAAIGLGAGMVYNSYKTGQQQVKAQQQANSIALANANAQATAADQAMNRANQKRPDTQSILDAATQSGRAGVSGTMLTGPQGVAQNQLSLGKSTLLGQ